MNQTNKFKLQKYNLLTIFRKEYTFLFWDLTYGWRFLIMSSIIHWVPVSRCISLSSLLWGCISLRYLTMISFNCRPFQVIVLEKLCLITMLGHVLKKNGRKREQLRELQLKGSRNYLMKQKRLDVIISQRTLLKFHYNNI